MSVRSKQLDRRSETFADEVRKSLADSGEGSEDSGGVVTDSTRSAASSAYRMRTNVVVKKKVTLGGSQTDSELDRKTTRSGFGSFLSRMGTRLGNALTMRSDSGINRQDSSV